MNLVKGKSKLNILNNLVTGGAGFLGSNLIDHLIDRGESVLCIDNLSTGNLLNLKHLENNINFKFIVQDIREPILFEGKIDKIWHFACPPVPSIYQSEPLSTLDINYIGTLNLLKLAKKCNSRILLSSTSEIYGNTKVSPQFEDMPIDLLTNNPRACYSEGKRVAETLFFTFARQYNLNIRVARIFNTYGPRLKINDGRVISNFINQSLSKKNLIVNGDGLQTRSFCFVDDMVDGLLKLMDSDFKSPINLGNPSEISIIDLAKLIKSKMNNTNKIVFKKCNVEEPLVRRPSIDLAEKVLNWTPKISLNTGLNRTIEYFKNKHLT